MKVKKIEHRFYDVIGIGKYVCEIILDMNSVELKLEEVLKQVQANDKILITYIDDTMLQRDELSKLLKKVIKGNSDVEIIIHTKAYERPLLHGQVQDNVSYVVDVDMSKLSETNKSHLRFFSEINSKFLFNVKCEDEIDNVATFIMEVGIKKSQVYIEAENEIKDFEKHLAYNSFNAAFRFQIGWLRMRDFELNMFLEQKRELGLEYGKGNVKDFVFARRIEEIDNKIREINKGLIKIIDVEIKDRYKKADIIKEELKKDEPVKNIKGLRDGSLAKDIFDELKKGVCRSVDEVATIIKQKRKKQDYNQIRQQVILTISRIKNVKPGTYFGEYYRWDKENFKVVEKC